MNALKREFIVHFIGVGGVSMSGLAEYFLREGFLVSGSDRCWSSSLVRLKELGVKVFLGHNAENVGEAHLVIYSDAVDESNQELAYARQEKRFVLSRARALKMVAENFGHTIGVAGCHGKTTVTCMIAHILKRANIEFCAHIGGEDLLLGNFVYGGSKVFLSEVCEYKKNLDLFDADFPVIVNFGEDHMDCYKDKEELLSCYENFAKRGYKSIISGDDECLNACNIGGAVRFSQNGKGEVTAENIREKDGRYSFDLYYLGVKKCRIKLKVLGRHNVDNSLAAITCAVQMGIKFKHVKKGIESFIGVKRRFETVGRLGKGKVICDYAHHPKEIEACMQTVKKISKGEVFVVFQPHTYSRTKFLNEEFKSVLSKIQNLAIYKTFEARETPKDGESAKQLCDKLSQAKYFDDYKNLLNFYSKKLKRNDLLLILGAGDLYSLLKGEIVE